MRKLLRALSWYSRSLFTSKESRRRKAVTHFSQFRLHVTQRLENEKLDAKMLQVFLVGALIWFAAYYNAITDAPQDKFEFIVLLGLARSTKEAATLWKQTEADHWLPCSTGGLKTAQEWLDGDIASADMTLSIVFDLGE